MLLMHFRPQWTQDSQEKALKEFESRNDLMTLPPTSPAAMAMKTPRASVEDSQNAKIPLAQTCRDIAPFPDIATPEDPNTDLWRMRRKLLRERKRLLQEYFWRGTETKKVIKSAQSRNGPLSSSLSSSMSTIEKCDVNSSDSLHDCTKVQITVAEARLRDGSVVLLERGLAPVAGLIRYPLVLVGPNGKRRSDHK